MKKHKININITDFPKSLHHMLSQSTIYDTSCHSGATVLYCDSGYYIKVDDKGKLCREAEMIEHFARMGMGAELISYISDDKDYMVTRSARGEDATHYRDDPKKLCAALAEAMRRLHGMPIEGVPISPCMEAYVNLNDGANLKCDTLIHGDFCLPNVMLENGVLSSFIDVGQAGAGNRHIDIFWALWSLEYNLKTDRYNDCFLESYGREHIDPDILKLVKEIEMKN